jgi:hypothetical protein
MLATHSFHTAALGLRCTSWLQLAGYAYLGCFILLLVLLMRLEVPRAMGLAVAPAAG